MAAEGKLALGSILFDHGPCPVAVLDREGVILASNAAFQRLFGRRDGEPCYRAVKGRDQACERCPAREVFDDGDLRQSDEEGVNAQGGRIRCSVTHAPLRDGREVEQVVQIYVETTRLHDLQQALRQAERLATVGLSTAGLAHSIKNILGGLEGGVYVVDSALKKSDLDRLEAGWAMVQRYIGQVAALVQNLLRFAKAEPPRREPVQPAELLERVVQLYESKAELVGIELCAEGARDLEPVPMDPDAMHACLTNLVGNAIDACTWDPDTDKAHRIELRALSRPEGGVVFEVSDNGMGISEENQPKILAVHFTTKGIRGTGLGLLLTRKVVEEHGGTIAFASTPGEGATFRITLPGSPPPAGPDDVTSP
jgi:signal transduction histidine kinase